MSSNWRVRFYDGKTRVTEYMLAGNSKAEVGAEAQRFFYQVDRFNYCFCHITKMTISKVRG